MKMNDRQAAFLRVLANRENFAGSRSGLGAGRVFVLAYPDALHAGRYDAGATRTLDGLEKLGLVHGFYASVEATGRYWKITAAGRKALAEWDRILDSIAEVVAREW